MKEWGFIGQDTLAGIGKVAISIKSKSRRGYDRYERFSAFKSPLIVAER